jgi:Crp-like helix-turn-helix domain
MRCDRTQSSAGVVRSTPGVSSPIFFKRSPATLLIRWSKGARWLLMWGYHTEDDTLEITQEYLAELLGVRRSTLTVVASALQKAGLIRCRRGAITVLDWQKLEAASCECYRIVRDCSKQPPEPMDDRGGDDATQAGEGVGSAVCSHHGVGPGRATYENPRPEIAEGTCFVIAARRPQEPCTSASFRLAPAILAWFGR